VVLTSKILS